MGKERDKLLRSLGETPSKETPTEINKKHRAKQIEEGKIPSDIKKVLEKLKDENE